VGGIASAARLAKAGFKVTVLEKNDFTGGRCSLIHHDGYRFDQGETPNCCKREKVNPADTNQVHLYSFFRTSSKKPSKISIHLWQPRVLSY
jgi:monoamine oxidase